MEYIELSKNWGVRGGHTQEAQSKKGCSRKRHHHFRGAVLISEEDFLGPSGRGNWLLET